MSRTTNMKQNYTTELKRHEQEQTIQNNKAGTHVTKHEKRTEPEQTKSIKLGPKIKTYKVQRHSQVVMFLYVQQGTEGCRKN